MKLMSGLIKTRTYKKLRKISRVIKLFLKSINPIYSILLLLTSGTYITYIFYSIGYSFLYGFYFGGTDFDKPSIFETISLPVPFNFYSVIIISIFVVLAALALLSMVWMSYLSSFNKENGKVDKFVLIAPTLVFLLGFHGLLSLFFIESNNDIWKHMLGFAKIWIAPGILAILLFWMIRSIIAPLYAASGFLYGLFISASAYGLPELFWNVETVNVIRDWVVVFFPYFTFLISALSSLLKKSPLQASKHGKLIRFLVYLPFLTTTIFLLWLWLIDTLDIWIGYWLMIVVPLSIITILLAWKPTKLWLRDSKPKNDTFKNLNRKANPIAFVGIFIIGLFVSIAFIPNQLMLTGKMVREAIPNKVKNDIQLSPTPLINADGIMDPPLLKAKLVAEKNGVLYLSDDNWKLQVIQSNFVLITSPKNERKVDQDQKN